MSNYKQPDHETSTELQQEINPDLHYVVPVDMSPLAVMQRNGVSNFVPQYSGDIPDLSNVSLMEIRSRAKLASNEVEELQKTLDSYKAKPIPTKPLAPLDENGNPE